MNQELYNRIFAATQGILNQYMFEPADSNTEYSVHTRVSGYLSPLKTVGEIAGFSLLVMADADARTLDVMVSYKEPNFANAITINLTLGPVITPQDRFDNAMKGI